MGPLTLICMAAIAVCYAAAAWHFFLLARDVRAAAKAEAETGLTVHPPMSKYFPFVWGDLPYRNQMLFAPQYKHHRRRMYIFAAVAFALFLLLMPQFVSRAAAL